MLPSIEILSPLVLSIIALWALLCAVIAMSAAVQKDGPAEFYASIPGVHALEFIFAVILGFAATFGGILRRSVTIMGFISFVAGLMLMMFAWMGAGTLVLTTFHPTSKAAMAFDILCGLSVLVFLVGSVKKHRFYDIEYPPTETGVTYISPRYLLIVSIVLVVLSIIAAATTIRGSVNEAGAGHATIIGLSVMMILTSLGIAACTFLGAHLQRRPELLGAVSFIAALFLLMFAFLLTGQMSIFKSEGVREAALAFDIITGIATMVFLFGSVKEHRFTEDEVVATRYILEQGGQTQPVVATEGTVAAYQEI